MVGYKAKVGIVVDTSGSMSDEMLRSAMSEVFGIARASGVDPVLISCDAAAHIAKSFSRQPQLIGGGGTDMGVGIAKALECKTNICIVLTDGFTPWPANPPPKMRVVVCIVPGGTTDGVPAWTECIKIDGDEK
jgi:predicted metal-dependent peptidase